MLRYDSAGANTLAVKTAGVCGFWGYCGLVDVATDGSGNTWVADYGHSRIIQYDSSGTLLQTFPTDGAQGTDNTHFRNVGGIAFDGIGRMFVSDTSNHRIQVYTFSGGVPVYSATIGVTGVSGNDNSHFNMPGHLAVDSSNRLYVVDSANLRIQRCSFSGTWTCSLFARVSNGIAVDGSNNVYVLASGTVGKCDPSGNCVLLINAGTTLSDVAVDSAGNIYVSEYLNHRVQKYNSSGTLVGTFAGTANVPYVPDNSHLNYPTLIALASDGSIFAAEHDGQRLVKMNASGVIQWAFGVAATSGSDTAHLNSPEHGNLAIDSGGRIYVPDTGNNRIMIINPEGTYNSSFGTWGTGNNQFERPYSVAITPANGDIIVADGLNHRVQVFDSNWTYKATLGTTGVSGTDGTHFNSPQGVAIDSGGNVLVSDYSNYRVQKCALSGSSGTCTTLIGTTGSQSTSDLTLLSGPRGLAIDSAGRIYVVDGSGVKVFDSSGNYLATMGRGSGWTVGTEDGSGDMSSPSGVALDNVGNVFVTDSGHHRVQKFTPGVPGWIQTNINGFGNARNRINVLAPFGGQLYAGSYNLFTGAQLWRTSNATGWASVFTNGFGDTNNYAINFLSEFSWNLYAGTSNQNSSGNSLGGQIWRSNDGTNWNQVASGGFGDTVNTTINRFAVFNNQIYVGTTSFSNAHGAEVWRSSTGNSGEWTRVVSNGFNDDANNWSVYALEVFNGNLYAGVGNLNLTTNVSTGGTVWRSPTGDSGTWVQVSPVGFGSANNQAISSLSVFNNYLYASTMGASGFGDQVWRCQVCDNSDWQKVVDNGLGNTNNNGRTTLKTFNGALYLVLGNTATGMEVWRTQDGTTWSQIGFAGFGTNNNVRVQSAHAITTFNNNLYLGTYNASNGGQVWQLISQQYLYLPLILR